jgi:antitoxin (DNA-binding transcriptional repressor) of toxin-antitoxin stability system
MPPISALRIVAQNVGDPHPKQDPKSALYIDVRQRTILTMTSMSVSEARAALPQLLSRVQDGEEVTITRHGQPVAILVRPDILQRRRAEVVLDDAGRIHDLLTEAAATPLPPGPGLTAERAEELIGHIRAGRDAG